MWNIHDRALVSDSWREELASSADQRSSRIAPGNIVVSLERWRLDGDALIARGSPIGVRLAPDEKVRALRPDQLRGLWMVDLQFADFADGRGYSQARQLRQGLGFGADIRAIGTLSRDQIGFMERCGINLFRFAVRSDAEQALAAFTELSLCYQGGGEQTSTIAHRRGHRRAA